MLSIPEVLLILMSEFLLFEVVVMLKMRFSGAGDINRNCEVKARGFIPSRSPFDDFFQY